MANYGIASYVFIGLLSANAVSGFFMEDKSMEIMQHSSDMSPMADYNTDRALGQCNDTLLSSCFHIYYQVAGLSGSLSSQHVNAFGAEVIALLSNGTDKQFRQFCNAATVLRHCLASQYLTCLNVPNLSNGLGVSLSDAFGYVSIFKQINYMCGAALPIMLNNRQCFMNTYNNGGIAQLTTCQAKYVANASSDVTNTCKHEQSFVICAATVFSGCNQQTQLMQCQLAKLSQIGLLGVCQPTCRAPFPMSPTPPPTTPVPPPINNSPGFSMASNMFLAAINFTVDPCQDFFHYACGTWMSNNPIPAESSSSSNFGTLGLQVRNQTNAALKGYVVTSASPRSLKQTKLVYDICRSSNSSNYDGTPIIQELAGLGRLPALNAYYSDTQNTALNVMQHAGTVLGNFGSQSIITAGTDLDWRMPTQNVIQVDQASTIVPRVYYAGNNSLSYRASVLNYINSTMLLLASLSNPMYLPNAVIIQQDVQAMALLDYNLAMANVPDTNRRNFTQLYNKMTITQANAQWPNLHMTSFITTMVKNYIVDISTITRKPIIVNSPTYMTFLNTQLNIKANRRTMLNYLLLRIVVDQSMFLPKFNSIYEQFKRETEFIEALPPQESMCTSLVTGYLPYTTGRLYIDTHFSQLPANTRPALSSMITSVLNSFKSMVTALQWMDAPSKQAAYGKISNLVQNVAYPDFLMNNQQLDNYYPQSQLNIQSTDNLFHIILALTRMFQWRQITQLQQVPQRNTFGGSPAIVNAWYNPEVNSITFPAGILNVPFFRTDYPMSVNYGAMGAVMGHELTHGFDDMGTQFNGTGYLTDWITPASAQGFKDMANCVIQEYGQFCYPPSKFPTQPCVNGVRTQGENIADNGGIKASFNAYQTWVATNGIEGRLPGAMSQFTANQLFFLSFGHVWCQNIKDSALQRQIALDPHSPAQYRVIGTLRNFPAFAQAFNCPVGSPMAPKSHCTVW